MKTVFAQLSLLTALVSVIACSKGSGSSSETASTSSVIMSVTQSPNAIGPGQSMLLTPTGGTPPYTFRLGSSAGTLSTVSGLSSSYTMDANGDMGVVYIQDSVGLGTQIAIASNTGTIGSTTGSTGATGPCSGTYSMELAGTPGTLKLVSDNNGNLAGSININGGYAAIQGTCMSGSINFTNQFSGSVYTGTYGLVSNYVSMSGSLTDTYGNVSSWSAVSQ